MNHIVITTDFSKEAECAYAVARRQAELFGQGKVELSLITILDDRIPTNIEFDFGLTFVEATKLIERAEAKATTLISELAKTHFPGYSITTKVIRTTGPVYTAIVDYADSIKAELIVIATHGRTGVKHLIIGSVAEKVVQHAHCPVLVVPVPAQS